MNTKLSLLVSTLLLSSAFICADDATDEMIANITQNVVIDESVLLF